MISDNLTMKRLVQIIIFSFLISLTLKAQVLGDRPVTTIADQYNASFAPRASNSDRLREVTNIISNALKVKKGKPEFIRETTITDRTKCSHCPEHLKLTQSVNGILQKLKDDPSLLGSDEIPVSINRLNFLFYTEKSRLEDGTIVCNRFLDNENLLKQTTFPGTMELKMEDVFNFDGVNQLQILDPKKEEITYYYRGEGSERNIIVQAILTKEGGKLRYFYYRPSTLELNPYNLPDLGGKGPKDETSKIPKVESKRSAGDFLESGIQEITTQDKTNFSFDPKIIMQNSYILKNIQLAKASLSQEILGTGLRVNGESELSLKGNKGHLNLQNEKGNNLIVLDVNTSSSGKTRRTIVIPYEINMSTSAEDSLILQGRVEDNDTHSVATFALTDKVGQYFRSEVRKDKHTGISVFGVAKDFVIDTKEAISVIVGKNETRANYVSLQHKKAIKDNITVVLDARVDSDKVVTLMYQMRAKF